MATSSTGATATPSGSARTRAGAFWSITMYDLPGFYLVANPISRYSIGDRTPGLRRDSDGSLTIVIQHDQPADTSNWLPAPAAPFRPLMRLYQPHAAILDATLKGNPTRHHAPYT